MTADTVEPAVARTELISPGGRLELGVQSGQPHSINRMIYRGDEQPLHPETNARAAFDRLFLGPLQNQNPEAIQHPSDVVCSGPKYQYPYTSDNVHLVVDGYELLGEKYAQVFYERQVLGSDWQPLQPTTVARAGRVVSVSFHVPVPPLVWEETFQLAVVGVDDQADGTGTLAFEVWGDNEMLFQSSMLNRTSAPLPIDVEIVGVFRLDLKVTNGDDGGPGLAKCHARFRELG